MILSNILRRWMLPLSQIDLALPDAGLIYEIGSGKGVICRYLSHSQPRRRVIGLDLDANKILQANTDLNQKNLTFIKADALTYTYLTCDGVVLSDFLHHLKFKDQTFLLNRITIKLKKGGILVIKEIDKNDGILRYFSRLWDFIFYPQDKIYYREKNGLIDTLTALGFIVSVSREVKWFPGSTFLYICCKK